MNKLTHITGFLFLAIIIFSCATTSPREKLLVGKWKPVKVENANTPIKKKGIAKPTAPDTLKPQAPDIKTDSFTVVVPKEEQMLNRMIQSENRTSFQLNADKTAIKYYAGKAYNGTWKLKKHGTIFTARNPETGKKVEMEIIRLNDTSAMMTEQFPYGKIRITYHKEK